MPSIRSRLGRVKRAAMAAGRRARCAFAEHAVCLIYHRVAALDLDSQQLAVTPDRFRDHLRRIKEGFRPVGPEELHSEMTGAGIRPKGVAITFDDGYADNFLHMLPIVEEEKVPVTVFVSTDLLGTDREFWWDELERIFLTGHALPPSLDCAWGDGRLAFGTDSPAAVRETYARLHPMVKALSPEEREIRLAALRAWAGIGD